MSLKDRIHILQGDLTDQDADAIVNAANNALQLGGGVAGAIRRKGGPAIQEECDRHRPHPPGRGRHHRRRQPQGPLRHPCRQHGPGRSDPPRRTSGPPPAAALLRAKEKGLRSIAFPAIGTGIAGFPMRRCAEVMIEEVLAHLRGQTSLEDVRFVLYDRPACQTFREVFEALPE